MSPIVPPLAFLPGCAIILMASLFPNSSFALPVYIGIGLYSILMTVWAYRKAAPQEKPEVKRQILISASLGCVVVLGIGVMFYLC